MNRDVDAKTSLYAAKQRTYYRALNPVVVSLLLRCERMLELGCAEGLLGKYARDHDLFRELYGVEINAASASAAAQWYTSVITADIESLDFSQFPAVDAIICADVIEHLVDPWTIIERLVGKLAPNGYLVMSIPNSRHVRFWGKLAITGRFDYEESGLLDRGHLRFFAFRDLQKIFEQNSLRVEKIVWRTAPYGSVINRLTFGFLKEFFAYQFVFRLRKK